MNFKKLQSWAFTFAAVSAALISNGCTPTQQSSQNSPVQEESISQSSDTSATQSTSSDTASQDTVQRIEPNDPSESSTDESTEQSTEQSTGQSIKAPIQTQFGPAETEVDLMSAQVTGDILTVTLRYRPSDKKTVDYFPIEQVKYIDDTTSTQYGVAKDQAGEWLASPKSPNIDKFTVNTFDGTTIAWFKFPAPPPETETISIGVPSVGPFDGVTVSRRG